MNSSYQKKIANIQAKISHYLPIVLNWVWKNIVVNSYKFRIIEILIYLFIYLFYESYTGGFPYYFIYFEIALSMFFINVLYEITSMKSNIRVIFYKYPHWTRFIGFFISVLVLLPIFLVYGLAFIVFCLVIYLLFGSIKFIINAFKK